MEDYGRRQAEQPPMAGFERSEKPAIGVGGPSEGARKQAGRPDPEVPEQPVRRSFSAAYKLKVLAEADQCTGRGELGAILRREGLYSSHLTTWRQQRDQGSLEGLAPKKRGRKARRKDALAEENERLRRKNARLEHQLRQAETIIEVQKKLCTMLGLPHASADVSGNEE